MNRAKSDYSIQTVSNALRLLEAFDAEAEIGVTALSRRLNLHKNNVFRLLATLEDMGWVEQSADSERYRLGTACLRIARAYAKNHGLAQHARPVLVGLAARTGETAHLAVLRDFEVVHLDGEQSEGLVMTGLRTGQRMPVHSSALGKVLLGCGPAAELERFDLQLATRALPSFTEATICDRDKLVEHLRSVGAQGFALDLEESSCGVHCAAAPVYDGADRLVAALSISGPAFRAGRDELEGTLVPAVVEAATNLSRSLGASS